MGRHSDPDRSSYYRSVAGALGKGAIALLAVVVVVVGAIWFMNQRGDGGDHELVSPGDEDPVGDDEPVDLADFHDDNATEDADDEDTDGDDGDNGDDPDADEGDPDGDEGDDAEGDQEGDGDEGDGDAEGDADADADAIDPASVRVQVLDGGVGPELTEAAAEFIREFGYEVPVVDTANCCYPETTVLFNEGQEEAANGLVDRDERIVGAEPNPNLTAEVEIHIIIGENWPQEGEPAPEDGEPEDPEQQESPEEPENPEEQPEDPEQPEPPEDA